MNEQDILIKLNDHDHELGSLKHRVKELEVQQGQFNALVRNVDKLATNMENMLKEQSAQRAEIELLKQSPAEEFKYYKHIIIGCVITGVVGTLVGAILAAVIR